MEWLRSCYESYWRLSDDSTVWTRGRYVFVPDDTPFYPAFHNYGSRNWSTDDFPNGEPTRGEVRSVKQRYFNGLSPNPLPLARTIGTAEEIASGGRPDSFCEWRFEGFDGATWSEVGQGARIEFEDSFNCGGINSVRQYGRATVTFGISKPRALTLTLRGNVERQHDLFDEGQVFLDGNLEIFLHGTGELLGCAMGLVEQSVTRDLAAGVHTLEFTGDTIDGLFHVDAWYELALLFDPPLPADETLFFQGYPMECYFPSGTIIPSQRWIPDILSGADQLAIARIIVLLYDDPPAAQAALELLMGPTATVTVVPNSDSLVPGSVIGVRDDLTVVILAGTSNELQAATYSVFSLTGPADFAQYSTNLVWKVAASETEDRVNAAGADPAGRILLAGHSYGGAAAALLAADYRLAQPARDIDVLTYGAAKPGDERLAVILKTVRLVRLANHGDPIPALPPSYLQALPYFGVLPVFVQVNWVNLTQPTGQYVLSAAGDKTETEDSTLSVEYMLAVVAALTTGPPLPYPFAHGSAEYVRRLQVNTGLP